MKKQYEIDLWVPDSVVDCVVGIVGFFRTHFALILWIIGTLMVAFGVPNAQENWHWWAGSSLLLAGFFREIFREREEEDLKERWSANVGNLTMWFTGAVVFGHNTGWGLFWFGLSILCYLIMHGIYQISLSDDVEKAKKLAEADENLKIARQG